MSLSGLYAGAPEDQGCSCASEDDRDRPAKAGTDLQRISDLNRLLHAVIETNPEAVAIAARLDNERRADHRGPLHGIPILLKDNIATGDTMQTTAGSLAIYGCRVPGDAVIVQRLRAAGAVLLGKTNLGEWARLPKKPHVFSGKAHLPHGRIF